MARMFNITETFMVPKRKCSPPGAFPLEEEEEGMLSLPQYIQAAEVTAGTFVCHQKQQQDILKVVHGMLGLRVGGMPGKHGLSHQEKASPMMFAKLPRENKKKTKEVRQHQDEEDDDDGKCDLWLQQLEDLEAQPLPSPEALMSAACEPAAGLHHPRTWKKILAQVKRVSSSSGCKVMLAQQQRGRMGQIEVLDILEKGELVCCCA